MTLLICELAFKSRVFRFGLWIPPERLMAGHNMVTHYCYHWNYNKKKRETLVSGQNHLKHPYYGAASLDYFRKVFESVDQCYCVLVWETQWKLSHISWIGSTCLKAAELLQRDITFNHQIPWRSRYSFERLSWSYPVVSIPESPGIQCPNSCFLIFWFFVFFLHTMFLQQGKNIYRFVPTVTAARSNNLGVADFIQFKLVNVWLFYSAALLIVHFFEGEGNV